MVCRTSTGHIRKAGSYPSYMSNHPSSPSSNPQFSSHEFLAGFPAGKYLNASPVLFAIELTSLLQHSLTFQLTQFSKSSFVLCYEEMDGSPVFTRVETQANGDSTILCLEAFPLLQIPFMMYLITPLHVTGIIHYTASKHGKSVL